MGSTIARTTLTQPNNGAAILVTITQQTNKKGCLVLLVSNPNSANIQDGLQIGLYFHQFTILKMRVLAKEQILVLKKIIPTLKDQINARVAT
jgi:hypothetical protein